MNTHLLLPNLSPQASKFLLDLGHGKYDDTVAAIDKLLTFAMATPLAPEVAIAKEFLDGFVALDKATVPLSVEPDGRGGYVPSTNSHFDPKTGEFL